MLGIRAVPPLSSRSLCFFTASAACGFNIGLWYNRRSVVHALVRGGPGPDRTLAVQYPDCTGGPKCRRNPGSMRPMPAHTQPCGRHAFANAKSCATAGVAATDATSPPKANSGVHSCQSPVPHQRVILPQWRFSRVSKKDRSISNFRTEFLTRPTQFVKATAAAKAKGRRGVIRPASVKPTEWIERAYGGLFGRSQAPTRAFNQWIAVEPPATISSSSRGSAVVPGKVATSSVPPCSRSMTSMS